MTYAWRVWAAEAVSGGDPLALILQWGPAGVLIMLVLLGWLIPKGAYEQMREDRDRWQAAYERERGAHNVTRDALADAARANVAGLEAAKTSALLLTHLGHSSRPGGD